jgi:hypothetical protein
LVNNPELEEAKFYLRPNGKRKGSRCILCYKLSFADRWITLKQQAVTYKGGKCERCGYDKCAAALHFHHRDPNKKDDLQWNSYRNRPLDAAKKQELDGCDLLCANCHAEVHWELDVKDRIEKYGEHRVMGSLSTLISETQPQLDDQHARGQLL